MPSLSITCAPQGAKEGRVAKLAEQFGREVRARRKARGMTQAQLSEAAGISEEWLRRIERGAGSPSFEALEALSRGLACPIADLFDETNERSEALLRIEGLLSGIDERKIVWVEELLRVALRRP